MFGEDQCVEAFRAAVSTGKALLITPHRPACFFGLRLSNRRLCHAHDQSPKHSQDQRRIGVAHSAAILIQRDVQRVVQSTLDDPIAPLEFDPTQRVQLLQGQAADQIDRFGCLLALAPHAPSQPRNQPGTGKTDLLRGDFPAFQKPNLTPAAIAFPRQRAGLRRGWRGKNRSGSGASSGFEPVPSGCL